MTIPTLTIALQHRLDRLPTTLLLRLSVIFSGVAGFCVGLALLWATASGLAGSLPFAALAQAHGQVQTLGFVGLFILGTAAQLVPGFLTYPLRHHGRFVLGGLLLATALALRILAQPFDPGPWRSLALASFGILQLAGIALCLASLTDLVRRTIQPPEIWRYLGLISFGFLGVSGILNLAAAVTLANGARVIPDPLDSALVVAELPGFTVFAALAVGQKIFSRFLLLQPTNGRTIVAGAGSYLVGTVLTVAVALVAEVTASELIQVVRLAGAWLGLAGILMFVGGIKLYSHPTRRSLAPNVTEPARHWVRIAFGWLIVANVISAMLATREILGGTPATYLEVAATRHALGQGFALTLVVAMSARILPGVSAWALTHPRPVEWTIAILTLGAALRVGGELAGQLGEPALVVAGLGGSLGTLGFLGFAGVVVMKLGTPSKSDRVKTKL
jgi:hypothetical protein